ncbi:MAG: response regulator transcription factor [Clostridia bacterium]|nr:response regulator transcription factor [Clostridia bacterium]
MISIAICDDSLQDATRLRGVCESFSSACEIEYSVFTDAEEFLSKHQKAQFDIVFLDVEMPNQSGLDVGKKIRAANNQTIIIFSTSYPQYAIDAYDCEAFHYLLKPISEEKLEFTLKRAIKKISLSRQYHCIKIHNTTRRLPLSDIYFIEYCRKHIIYHTKYDVIETTGRFSDVIDALHNHGFYQVHQGYIVNFDKVYDFKGYSIILDDKRTVMMSVRKKKEVVLAYSKYVEDNL